MKLPIIPNSIAIIPCLVTVSVIVAFGVGRVAAADFGAEHHHFQDPYPHVSSGMLLGVYAQADGTGLRVNSLIPGYSAVGRLQPGDVLLRMTADGVNVYHLYSLAVMEQAKAAVGPHREAAIEFYRPGVGLTYAWVSFTPIAGPAFAPTATRQYSAQFRLESEKPGCRAMFDRVPRSRPLPGHWTIPNRVGKPNLTMPPIGQPGGQIRIQPHPYPIQNAPGDLFDNGRLQTGRIETGLRNDNWSWHNRPADPSFRSPSLSSPSDMFGWR